MMANMSEWRLAVAMAVELRRHHLVLRAFVSSRRSAITIVVVVVVAPIKI